MSQRCTVCTHTERALVDRLLASGEVSQRVIAKRFGLSAAAVQRHAEAHLTRALARALKRQERAEDDLATTFEIRLHDVYAEARAALDRAKAEGQLGVLTGLLNVLNKNVELTGKAAGALSEAGREAKQAPNRITQVIVLPGPTLPAASREAGATLTMQTWASHEE